MLASPARTPPSGEASWLGCSPSSRPPTVVNIGADMPRWTSRNIRGQPWAVWKISNKPDLATKRNPWSLCWLVGGGLSTRRIVGLIGHGLFQAAHPRSVSSRRYKTTPLRLSVNSSGRIACVSFPSSLLGGPPDASYSPSACSSKPGLPQIRFDMVRWRRVETSKPPPSRLLDEHIARSVPFSILVIAREESSRTRSWFRYRSLTAAGKKIPLEPRILGQACFLTSPHKFCEVWLVSGILAWVANRHPDPGQGC